ncbi:MAG TPA: DUF2282 domain-containing protein [Amaricoccus sp.]|mgnify:CR=1 FL=1|uniref:BufA1 family periplasmic bufferin-type metallophore n=1 Tax=Amaricoccus sp. TaxID=1872485 RepID=UPI002B6256DE|nr:DUF2282 domain-containing protein [Amaricoccus sp.]HMQ93720.1 DUF2282 domain-containing protein [Amaricoccus sp.]HMR53157.1 DUF2282 domain-containing protein [Amaricoccus sp.]HMR60674.1 DUF2282 domain-containing protein [Amaricoccus sp.]HMU00053.1 DUF2282 domain-containing protein [Amaricoccus sp.]
MTIHNAMQALALAAIAATILPAAAGAAGEERCYGIARAGENDGIGSGEGNGASSVDFQGDAWVWVAAGTCITVTPPVQPDGTPRRGSLEPLDRDSP